MFEIAAFRRVQVFTLYAVVIAGFMALLAPGALAEQQVLRHVFPLKIGTFEIGLPVEAQVDMGAFGTPMPFVLRADVGPLIEQREALFAAAGVNDGLPGEISYNGTLMDVAEPHLHLKYHFTARRTERVLGVRVSVSTDASIETWLLASVADNRLRLAVDTNQADHGFRLNISNTLVDIAADRFDVRSGRLGDLATQANAFLASDGATLGVPEELRAADIRFASARFAVVDGKQVLEVNGNLTMGVEAWLTLIKALVS